MKLILTLLLAASVTSVVYAGTVSPPYEVGTWQGFRTAAVSYTFDDNLGNQYSIAVPMFNAKGFKLTLFTTSNWVNDWSSVKTAAGYGHEIASHAVSHPDFSKISSTAQEAECRDSQSAINQRVTNQKCVTLAYPYGPAGNETITAKYYIAARGAWGGIAPSTPSNFLWIPAVGCGELGNTDLKAMADSAASSGGWCVFLFHGINGDGYSPITSAALQESVNYMDSNRGKFWVQTFGNIARYIRERNDVSVSETASTSNSLTVSVTDTLDNSIYNFPITIRRKLPSGWITAKATQGGKDLGAQIVTVNSVKYLMFDAVPDAGSVTLTSSDGTYKIAARHSGKAIDACGAQAANGTQIIQWAYHGSSNQKWILTDTGNALYKIVSAQTGKCIEINGSSTAYDAKVQLGDYIGSANQKFTLTETDGGYYRITPTHAIGSCLDVESISISDGAKVHLWNWLGGQNQQWKLIPIN